MCTQFPKTNRLCLTLTWALASPAVTIAAELTPLSFSYHTARVLVPGDPATVQHYLAFPALLDLGHEVLVSYKRGKAHGGDAGASIDFVRVDKATRRTSSPRTIAAIDGKIMQMGEWVRYPNGDIANYIDAQQPGKPARIGMRGTRSTDGGATFGPVETLGVVDGVEYGYPFGFAVEGATTWAMMMTFSNLKGGYSVYPARVEAGQVCMLRSEDNGRTWKFVRNLSREFGDIPINESSFVRYDEGFLVATRGYDNRVRLHVTDAEFRVKKQATLTGNHGFIRSYVGRPRLFARDGRYYLMGRNWTDSTTAAAVAKNDGGPNMPPAMKLCLFRLDPETVGVAAYAVLDNAEGDNVTDAYYPMPYFVAKEGKTYLRVIDYKGVDRRPPQIVEFEYLWNEVR